MKKLMVEEKSSSKKQKKEAHQSVETERARKQR